MFEVQEWAERFRGAHGRAPRVLHIGNIANNAYLNARILGDRGIECHVACHDYYHIMGCPEWEDADLGPIEGSHVHPIWSRRELGSFRRPRWFAQGPEDLVILYLLVYAAGRTVSATLLWHVLELRRRIRARHGERPAAAPSFGEDRTAILRRFSRSLPPWLLRIAGRTRTAARRVRRLPFGLYRRLTDASRRRFRALLGDRPAGVEADLDALFAARFPGRETMGPEEREALLQRARRWSALLVHYDAVIGYATEGAIPLACGKRPYFAYEHGTIRSMPFQDDAQGRACALSYAECDEAIVTNCDNQVAAIRLGIPKFRFVPHPVNERANRDILARAEALRKQLREKLAAGFIVFHPSRQHWEKQRHPNWEKGNDILIEGFADFVEAVDGDAGAVFVDWGATVEESRKLLERRGIANRVEWIDPLPHQRMVEMIRASDLLADQFFLGAFGSTMPKALLHECPAMLYLDEARHEWCFPEMPPVLNARTPGEVTEGLLRLYQEPELARQLAADGRRWYQEYHSSDRIGRELGEMIATATDDRGATP
jgi:glycosyltransferase involved in cell wall biosynthesis